MPRMMFAIEILESDTNKHASVPLHREIIIEQIYGNILIQFGNLNSHFEAHNDWAGYSKMLLRFTYPGPEETPPRWEERKKRKVIDRMSLAVKALV